MGDELETSLDRHSLSRMGGRASSGEDRRTYFSHQEDAGFVFGPVDPAAASVLICGHGLPAGLPARPNLSTTSSDYSPDPPPNIQTLDELDDPPGPANPAGSPVLGSQFQSVDCVRASGPGSDSSLGDEAVSAEHDLVSAANLQQLTS